MRMSSACVLAGTLLLTSVALAQAPAPAPAPPRGPADIMNRAAEGRARSDVKRAAETAESAAAQTAPAEQSAKEPAAEGAQGESPQASDPHAHAARDPHAVLAAPEMASAEPSASLPRGVIDIEVVDPSGAPKPDAEIVLGIMAGMGGRTEQRAKSDGQGRYQFRDLAVGSQQAYRVNVLYEGAKFSSTPFRLPDDSGYRVRIPLRPTTTDRSLMFQVIGQTVVELRDERLHITQQARLANAGESVIVFPTDGIEVPLPEGFTAFQWQDQMTDQKGEELAGKGFRLRGSLPPGSVTLAWTYDVKLEGTSAKVLVEQPWRTYTYRVVSEAPPGLKLRVSEFPEPEKVEDNQRQLFFTQIQRRPNEARLEAFTIRLEGIPGPGPGRWIAAVLALIAVGIGLSRAFKTSDDKDERRAALTARKQELIALAKATESEAETGEIGPHYRAERLQEIVTELALVLRDEELLAASKAR